MICHNSSRASKNSTGRIFRVSFAVVCRACPAASVPSAEEGPDRISSDLPGSLVFRKLPAPGVRQPSHPQIPFSQEARSNNLSSICDALSELKY